MKPFSLGSQGVAALIALMQAVPAGHGLGNLFFLIQAFRRPPEGYKGLHFPWKQFQDFRHVLIAAYVMTGVHLLILFLHGASLREFEAYFVWLIWPFVLLGLLRCTLSLPHLLVGLALAGCLSGLAGLIDLFLINLYPPPGAFVPNSGALRVSGAMNNPLVYGNLSLLLATACLYILARPELWEKHGASEPLWLCLFGLCLGFIGSLLSGSKGGWVAALTLWPLLFIGLVLRTGWKRLFLVLASLTITVLVAVSLPMNEIQLRVINFQHALHNQLSRGLVLDEEKRRIPVDQTKPSLGQSQPLNQATVEPEEPVKTHTREQDFKTSALNHKTGIDSSITPRLVQWRLAFSETTAERIFIGMPRASFMAMEREALENGRAEGLIRPWRNLHNDLIDTFIIKGLLGLVSLLTFAGLVARFFYRRRKNSSPEVRFIAWLALLLLATVALFSISDVQLDKGAVTHTLTFLLLTLTALILQHENELPAHRL